jgi:hypothetical protein
MFACLPLPHSDPALALFGGFLPVFLIDRAITFASLIGRICITGMVTDGHFTPRSPSPSCRMRFVDPAY